MKFNYVVCWLIGLVTMFFSVLSDELREPYHTIATFCIYTLGLFLVLHIMYLDGRKDDDN